jgi:hypothetical protein
VKAAFRISLLFIPLFSLLLVACPPPDKPGLTIYNPTDNIQVDINAHFAPKAGDTWTIMIYMDGDNNLDANGIDDINEMEYGFWQAKESYTDIDSYLTIIALFDMSSIGDWTDTRLYEIMPDPDDTPDFTSEEQFDPSGLYGFATIETDEVERNMGDRSTLIDFLNFCTDTEYFSSTDHYGLVLWNHGDGPYSRTLHQDTKLRGIGDDWTSNRDQLSLEELQDAIEASTTFDETVKLDFIGFDACMMSAVETAYELRNLAIAMTGSMADEQLDGWNYTDLIASMDAASYPADGKALAKLVVQSYHDATILQTSQTMAAIDLSSLENLKDAVDSFAVSIFDENRKAFIEQCRDSSIRFFSMSYEPDAVAYPYFDLNDFCYRIIENPAYFSNNLRSKAGSVINAISASIIAAYAGYPYGNYYGPGSFVKRGMYIVFPMGEKRTYLGQSYYSEAGWYTISPMGNYEENYYGEIDFCTNNSNGSVESWLELLEQWYDEYNTLIPWNTY